MTESVVFDINGDPKGAEAAFARLQKELDKTKQKVVDLTAEAKKSAAAGDTLGDSYAKSAKAGEAMADGFMKRMAGAITLTGVLNAALKVTKAEYDNVIERQQKAAQTVLGTANSEMAMLRNVSPQDHAYWRAQVPAMAQRTGQKIGAVQQAIADASSAQGNQTNDQLRQNVELAMMVNPDNPVEAQVIAGGLGDASRLTGSSDARVNMGAILAMGKQARVKSTAKIAENLIPGSVSVKGYGGTASEAMALSTTLSTLLNDQQGNITQSSARSIASELDRIYGADKTPLEHITALQNDPKLLKKWYEGTKGQGGKGTISKASIPGEAEIAFKDLVTKGSEADKLLRSNLQGYGSDADQAALTADWLKSAYNSEPQRIAKLNRSFEATTNALENANTQGASAGAMRARVDEALVAGGASWMQRTGYAWKFDARTSIYRDDPILAGVATLADYRDTLASDPNRSESQRASDKETIAILNTHIKQMIEELKGLRRDQQNAPKPKNVDQHTE